MEKYTIELFLPLVTDVFEQLQVERYLSLPQVKKVWLLSTSTVDGELPEKVSMMQTDSLQKSTLFKSMAECATADYVLFFAKGDADVDVEKLCAFVEALPADASMGYSNYFKSVDGAAVEAPTIDYQAGSLRNDFDFGSLLLFRTSALKQYLAASPDDYEYAGLYQLRLAMSRVGKIYHHDGYVYTEPELDTRKSGEKQFDYVNPAQRNVQVEMEQVCTHHLKAIGAWLPPCKYSGIDLSNGTFPVEASVVIPVLNRRSTIADAINSVLNQQTSFAFNILVVDNHSTDGTSEIPCTIR